MKAAVLHEARQPLRIEDLELPDVGDEDVLIKVAACGVCHTDLKVVEGRNRFTPPTILGHEVAGIQQVGARCQGFKVGDPVIIGMRYKCGRCRYCLTARENLCEKRPAPPALRKPDGSVVTRWNVWRFCPSMYECRHIWCSGFQNGMSMEEASIVGCRVTTAYNAVKHRAGRTKEPGDSALVIGCGGIGLNTIQFLRCFAAYTIVAVDVVDDKLEAAKKFGATHTINASATGSGAGNQKTH